MSQKDRAYDYLKNAIVTNTMSAGTPVREMDIAAALQMSRTPIREAMRELEIEGALTSYPSRGAFVVPLTPSDVEEIYELRSLHELWAIERSFDRITDEELDIVERMLKESYEAKDSDGCHRADRLLHRLIVEKSGSKRLVAFINTLHTQIDRIRSISTSQDFSRMDRSYIEHMEITGLIRNRLLPKCKEALHHHLRTATNYAIEASKTVSINME